MVDHGSRRIGFKLKSDELKLIAPAAGVYSAEPFTDFSGAAPELLRERCGVDPSASAEHGRQPRPGGEVQEFVAALRGHVGVPIRTWDERLTSAQANRLLIQGNVRRDKRREKVDQMAAAILLQSYLDGLAG